MWSFLTEGAEGMLMTHGSRNAGYALFVKDGHLHYIHNYVGLEKFEVVSSEPVPTGEVSLRYEFEPTGEPSSGRAKARRAASNSTSTTSWSVTWKSHTPPPNYSACWARAAVMRPLTR
jgi:hypothetical protein